MRPFLGETASGLWHSERDWRLV